MFENHYFLINNSSLFFIQMKNVPKYIQKNVRNIATYNIATMTMFFI